MIDSSGLFGRVSGTPATFDARETVRAARALGFSLRAQRGTSRPLAELGTPPPQHCPEARCDARIADERSNELQRRRLLRRTSAHNPVPVFIGEHREVLHRLHISPTGQRFPRAWDVDVPPGTFSAALKASAIACQLVRIFDCGRAPCKGEGCKQPN